MAKETSNKTISIVFTETGPKDSFGKQPFNVFMEGFPDESRNKKDEDLSAAEFWAKKMFDIVVHNLKESGVVNSQHTLN